MHQQCNIAYTIHKTPPPQDINSKSIKSTVQTQCNTQSNNNTTISQQISDTSTHNNQYIVAATIQQQCNNTAARKKQLNNNATINQQCNQTSTIQ